MYEIHRNPKLWENASSFIPERFLEGKNYSSRYFPFGAGPRKCIGNNFAMYELILVVNEVFQQLQLKHRTSPIEILPLISLKPKNAFLTFFN
jgi:cytochrome P450